VCNYRNDYELFTLNKKDIEKCVNGAKRFLAKVLDPQFIINLEESSPAFQLGILIKEQIPKIKRVRLIILTNGILSLRKKVLPEEDLGNYRLNVNILDLERYSKIISQGSEPVEVDFESDFGGGLKSLAASPPGASYRSFLFAIPGSVLAEIFATYKNRLLEKNVRTYLQAVTKVNKGILQTISSEPHMFFAYNNGITATASDIELANGDSGELLIRKITDFQIVNGGQTTASLNYARDAKGYSLDNIFVQVKLAVIEGSQINEVVPNISKFANTQNKVSTADLEANSEVQVQIERISKQVQTPQRAGEIHSSKWFYERARGQFKSLFAYKSPSEKKKLELLYPRKQLITKTDLAKYDFAFDARPHHVSEGAQKCFSKYTSVLSKLGASAINESWFKRSVSKAILFNELDNAVLRSEWYQADRGYKAQIVAYSISASADSFRASGLQIDLDRIWREQSVNGDFLYWLLNVAHKVAQILKSPPPEVRNISEFAKREFCWSSYIRGHVSQPSEGIKQYGISLESFLGGIKAGKKDQKIDEELDFDVAILQLASKASEIIVLAQQNGVASPKNISALKKLELGKAFSLNKGEKNALKSLLQRLGIGLHQ
ncbi:MAG TPA: hypothetical protein DCR51_06085, partial [Idiomarina loihiensis]|nr:hypothetical protein [Idiomarina loihiensis]